MRAAYLLLVLFLFLAVAPAAEKTLAKPSPADAAVAAIGSTTEPCEALANVARLQGIPLAGMHPFSNGTNVNPGDSITALVTLVEKSRKTQWLLYLKAGATNALTAPTVAMNKTSKRTMYSSTGRTLRFESALAPATVRTLGPYAASEQKRKLKPADKTAQLALDQEYLGLGLDKAAIAVLRLQHTKPKGIISFAGRPFSEKDIAQSRKLTNLVHMTAEDERALAGSAPALESYFNIVQRTEGLSDILFELVDLPSMWSIARNGGVTVNFRFLNKVKEWEAVAGKISVYEIPIALELNGQPSLIVTIVATNPRPPLLACAGILGLVATRPGAKDTFLAVQVISAKHSNAATNTVAALAGE